jgi:hypothetical protein
MNFRKNTDPVDSVHSATSVPPTSQPARLADKDVFLRRASVGEPRRTPTKIRLGFRKQNILFDHHVAV